MWGMQQRWGLGLLGLAVVLSGCVSPPPPQQAAPAAASTPVPSPSVPRAVAEEELAGTEWEVAALQRVPALKRPIPWLRFEGLQRVSGDEGCIRFVGKVRLQAPSMRFEGLKPTKVACTVAAPGQDDQFFLALERTRQARWQGAELELLDAQGQWQMRLKRR